jgi:hypothetical protein
MQRMAKKGAKPDDQQPASLMLRLHPRLRAQLERLCELNASNVSDEIRIAIRERLERHNLWPSPPASP